MRRPPGEGEWIVMRFWRTVVGVVFGGSLGIVVTSQLGRTPLLKGVLGPDFMPERASPHRSNIAVWRDNVEHSIPVEYLRLVENWIWDGLPDWNTAFWTIILTPIAGGAVGLWLDVRAAREWKRLERPQDQQVGSPSKHTGRRSRRWTRFRRPQDQRRPKR